MNPDLTTGTNQTLIYRFLTSPRFRIGRHGVLLAVLVIISFNQTFLSYQDSLPRLGAYSYLIVFFVWFTYASVVYFNLRYLLPRYLLQKRYMYYLLFLTVAMNMALILQVIQEYIVYQLLGIIRMQGFFSSMRGLMDYVSSFLLDMLCMVGGAMTVMLKLWMVDNQRVKQLEKIHTQSEVMQLKEQISPNLLFKILNRSAQLVLTEGDKASQMLMKLSQLLRYQLYDCSREKVLLSAEIHFLANYLSLEQLYAPRLSYTLVSEGEVNCRLVPPLLFIPFVQHAVRQSVGTGEGVLTIRLEAGSDDIVFTCHSPGADFRVKGDLDRICQRLDLQYRNRYGLLISGGVIRLELKGGQA